MENNKILIGVQFTDVDTNGNFYHYTIELYVLRDLPLNKLIEGVGYGLTKLSSENGPYSEVYNRCKNIFTDCLGKIESDPDGRVYFSNVTYAGFNGAKVKEPILNGSRTVFYQDEWKKPICDFGFITSTRLIFDTTGKFSAKGSQDTSVVVEAFKPGSSDKIFFPEYNISTRQLYRFNDEPVDIIAPADPPQKPNNNLFFMLLPSLLTVGILMLVRTFLMGGSASSNIAMIGLSAAMGITAAVTTTITWRRQKSAYEQDLKDWRSHYEDYIDSLIRGIQDRQARDALKLDELYPDILMLLDQNSKGVYSLNENIYSRSPNDDDFLTFRIGISDKVESKFPVKGGNKDVVFSQTFFDIVKDKSGNNRLRIFLRNELKKSVIEKKESLNNLPAVLSSRFKYMDAAPLLYSLKNKSALGVVDRNINLDCSYAKYFISRMIFELCYYHSPEDLQFIVFFNEAYQWTGIENAMFMYKFMPHFRGLFDDKSQFVFDSHSASLVLGNLLTMMNNRKANAAEGGEKASSPHIVFIVFNDFCLKEHAFAEFLPKVPENQEKALNKLGLTFVFASKYKEYLPAFCDDIVCFEGHKNTLTPHSDINMTKDFHYSKSASDDFKRHFYDYMTKVAPAFRFLSSVYFTQIAQNGKVPSSVSAFELLHCSEDSLEETIKGNWGFLEKKPLSDVTESLMVPVGKTETGTAYLDLHEKGDGPHMLVAGTTGSGKTETIITFLVALCMKYRPDELNLLLVDMKGGGFTKRIGNLPHVVGMVTDVDGDENGTGAEYMLGRFLFAMKSEIKRRKMLFNDMHVDSIDAYISACRNIESHLKQKKISEEEAKKMRDIASKKPLSHLILVVDEFTELKRFSNENGELDYMGEITTIARIGRSLGFHIILISQNIENAITDDIRVNSKTRLCLKVATRQASKEMIGTELAASPYMPGNGRAYMLVGTGSKLEYFQSGYSGADTVEDVPVKITLASKTGAYTTFYNSNKDNRAKNHEKEKMKEAGISKTQLNAISNAVCRVYGDMKDDIVKPHIVFNPPLPTCIALDRNGRVVYLNKEKGEK